MLGKRVKLVYVHDMSPMVVHELVGESGVVMGLDKIKQTDKPSVDVWLVVFDNGKRLWSRKKYLEVVNESS